MLIYYIILFIILFILVLAIKVIIKKHTRKIELHKKLNFLLKNSKCLNSIEHSNEL